MHAVFGLANLLIYSLLLNYLHHLHRILVKELNIIHSHLNNHHLNHLLGLLSFDLFMLHSFDFVLQFCSLKHLLAYQKNLHS